MPKAKIIEIEITQDELKEIFNYDSDTGVFRWKTVNKFSTMKVGDIAGNIDKTTGYCGIKYNSRRYKSHRLAWLYVYRKIPVDKVIDHVDGNPSNNRISNLRLCLQSENMRNRKIGRDNKSGHKGVSWHKSSGKWKVQVSVDSKVVHLGLYITREEASAVYNEFCQQHHGEFYRDTTTTCS